jgi:hypothetical protein
MALYKKPSPNTYLIARKAVGNYGRATFIAVEHRGGTTGSILRQPNLSFGGANDTSSRPARDFLLIKLKALGVATHPNKVATYSKVPVGVIATEPILGECRCGLCQSSAGQYINKQPLSSLPFANSIAIYLGLVGLRLI